MAFWDTKQQDAHWTAAVVLVAVLVVVPSLLTSTYAEIGKMECVHVDYLCFYHLDQCDAMCKDKASAEGSENYRTGCDGPGPDPRHQCCCTTLPPGPPPPFWPPGLPPY
ncbi:hypothetical protein BDA96_05G236900 [Sorghum bicolor]|uniref:Uncharacterized protein n=2 Tax=Sorghum bicolor TaxID=4558 RepID=A0A921R1Z2_SORBI|nr:uncharacterized protein LOC110435385 [Sorghum bicolor]EES10279.2 hypothetical protein SORBI_3005G221100 [Sorghum bicolor]KAG0531006.1 hypothetical protein BDA96_05G236900 [Sorghum bicolor]|eukprot:XP_021316562.1 uncharacterized protein LOC110435385 [Sorghum bicolor]